MIEQKSITWGEALKVYSRRPVIGMVFLGFSAGLPFLLVFSTLTAWLTESGVSRSAIGFFSWVGITYSIKVLWAPVVDRVKLPLLGDIFGQRRSWILLGQLGIVAGLVAMAMINPADQLALIAVCAVVVAFSSSTQDVAIDAYRIEAEAKEYQGAMSAAYIFGYRLALLVAGAGALLVADNFNWTISYFVMAGLMSIGVLTVLILKEPKHVEDRFSQQVNSDLIKTVLGDGNNLHEKSRIAQWLLVSVVCPFVEFFKRNGRLALVLLLYISVYRICDIAMGIMANPFYLDIGYTKTEIASVAKFYGFFMTILGSAVCGLFVIKWGIMRPMLLGAVLSALTNLLFASLAATGEPSIFWLTIVISADNLSGGIANTALIAYLSSLTSRSYTATQYAIFSSLMTLPGKFISGFSGVVVDNFGYVDFFIISTVLGLPAILLAYFFMKREQHTFLTRSAVEQS